MEIDGILLTMLGTAAGVLILTGWVGAKILTDEGT